MVSISNEHEPPHSRQFTFVFLFIRTLCCDILGFFISHPTPWFNAVLVEGQLIDSLGIPLLVLVER